MIRPTRIPEGFEASIRGAATLIADRQIAETLVREGLGESDAWLRLIAGAARGTTARVEIVPGRRARVKQLRRGGLAAPLWGERFVGSGRALDNLRLPLEAARLGLATPRPLALLIERAGVGLFRAWLACEEIERAVDLRVLLSRGAGWPAAEGAAALGLVRRMHDCGIEHLDLNLGNLLVVQADEPAAFVIDLDLARCSPGPLGFVARQRALRRLERSYVKISRPGPASEEIRDAIYSTYAAGDGALGRRLARGRATGRRLIRCHSLLWPS